MPPAKKIVVRKKNSKLVSQCHSCKKDFANGMPSIECFYCKEWYHLECTTLTNTHLALISELSICVEWFCINCQNKKHLLTTTDAESDTQKSELIDCVTDLQQSIIDIKSTVTDLTKQVISLNTISQSHTSSALPKVKEYSSVVKDTIQQKLQNTTRTTDNITATSTINISKNGNTKTDASQVLILYNHNDTFNKQAFHIKMNELFPKIKLVNSFKKPNNNILMFFSDAENANRVKQGWQKTYFGENTTIKFPGEDAIIEHAIIIKNIDQQLTDNDILNSIQLDFKSITEVIRFKKSGSILPIVKVLFSLETEKNFALESGVFIKSQYFKTEAYIKIIRPTRCFKCQTFGHTAKFCKNDSVCSKCSGSHLSSDCTFPNTILCTHCKGAHIASDKNCPKYIDALNKLNN